LLIVVLIAFKGYGVYQHGSLNVNGKKMYSQSAILMDDTGRVLGSKNKHKKRQPASLVKIMTAILALESHPDLNQVVSIDASQLERLRAEGASLAEFKPYSQVTIRQLLYGLMLPSGADAAVILAQNSAKDEAEFVNQMNAKAKDLGMNETHFANPTGIDDETQYTTVSDLAKLWNYCLADGNFKAIITTPVFDDGQYVFYSSVFNNFGDPNIKNGRLLGGKTGYTDEAGLCLASLAEVNGKEYRIISMGADGDHDTEQFNMIDARHIYEAL